jgi:hypothetical protein
VYSGPRAGSAREATNELGASYIVVDTGPWIFGKKVVLPAGVIDRIDLEDNRVTVRLTKDQIKGSPAYDAETYRTDDYRTRLGLTPTTGCSARSPARSWGGIVRKLEMHGQAHCRATSSCRSDSRHSPKG